ncbi:MAG: hypothetical protein IPH94_02695 [Saprospiraceae bacterium]|nr:hypothetical protein [Saprospiraceae bacterium]MBK7220270.1 hypothetical protein [Saprospiraceae bacterium]MBK8849228.1 hypothetical protein [Saprospiraceae bacterium]MBK9688872.1 hypothetical protein [Saprospiraceae bacterium]MBL0083900.1 hypothetical protein [Saprospiraceae bacterium]
MKYLFYLFNIIFITSCYGQSSKNYKEVPYLIMSHSNDINTHKHIKSSYKASDTSFVSLLLSFDKGKINVIDTLNYDIRMNNMVSSVTHYDEFCFFTIGEGEKDNSKNITELLTRGENYMFRSFFNILDYSSGNIIKRKAEVDSLPIPHGTSGDEMGYIIDGNFMFVCKPNKDLSNGKSFYNLTDKYSKIVRPLTDKEWMQNYYIKSHAGYIPNWYYNFVCDTLGNILHRNSSEDNPYKWEIFNFDYPRVKSEAKAVSGLNILYNTNKSKFLIGFKQVRSEYQKKGLVSPIYKKDKQTSQWTELKNLPSIQFSVYKDEYLYGTIMDHKNIHGEALEDTIAKYEMRNPKKYSTKYATTPNTTFMTGKFFIYHVPTQRVIEYKGQDIDTELLFIKDDWVYYRDFDKIKRIKLDISTFSLNSKSDKTLCQDREMIPNVHHIFWASEKPIEVEWLSPKPKNIK